MIRYPWYALQLLGGSPYALTWLRYTAFYPLYPTGMLSEVALLYAALPQLDVSRVRLCGQWGGCTRVLATQGC